VDLTVVAGVGQLPENINLRKRHPYKEALYINTLEKITLEGDIYKAELKENAFARAFFIIIINTTCP
jgi:hypothetical protein